WVTALILIGFVFLAVVGLWVFIDFVLLLLRSGSMSTDSRGVPLN
ncbi:MAG: TM2 domain-containing protein, partial [Corynebacterium marinum]|nr:TM2 domain-containing protein [Corynebacterium marinum]